MGNQKPSCWRAFWITAALISALNVSFWIYVALLPEAPIGKGGRMMKSVPEWIEAGMLAMNLPGIMLYALPIVFFAKGVSPSQFGDGGNAIMVITQLISGICWGGIAAAIERMRAFSRQKPVKPHAAPNDPAISSN